MNCQNKTDKNYEIQEPTNLLLLSYLWVAKLAPSMDWQNEFTPNNVS